MLKSFSYLFTKKNQLLGISLIWVLVAVVINPYGEFPFNDDWAYAQSVKALVEDHTFFVSGWTSVNLLVQIGWGALFCLPFGFSFTALRLSTLAAGLIGLWGTHRLIYNSTENPQIAFTGTLLTLVNPIYLGLSASFMTDVPFYALMVWTLACMVAGLKQDSTRFMVVGIGLAVVGLLIRQFGIALFAGFGLAYLVRRGIHLKNLVVAGACVVLGLSVQVGYQRWLSYMMPGTVSYNVQATNFFHLSYYKPQLFYGFINNTFASLMYVGLFMFPYFLVLFTKKSLFDFQKNRWVWLAATIAILGVWQSMFDGITMPVWWNTLSAFGLGPMLVRDLYFRLYGLPVPGVLQFIMVIVTAISLAGSICVLYSIINAVRFLINPSTRVIPRTVGVLLFSVLAIYFFPIGMQVLFDRYLLPIPVLVLILIHVAQSSSKQNILEQTLPVPLYLSVGLFGAYLLFSVFATHDYLAWNRVRWRALNTMVQQGIKPSEIDGGLEFNAWHLYDASYKPTPSKSWWWVHNDTYVLGASLLPGYTLFQEHRVDTWFPWGFQKITIGKKSQVVARNADQ
ncbi:glycosyltransferase family 39 protein [Spirosoma sp. KNUC1025]|uniref:glycosyltransferase family 39 protein n=1 Tax=Spirosoma sp. KNUC1025 TaxID=2894082 RepID=UPI00386D333C|nr:glycosyltransferase family 39 protein [Spirosoma sp. KNUC1025]